MSSESAQFDLLTHGAAQIVKLRGARASLGQMVGWAKRSSWPELARYLLKQFVNNCQTPELKYFHLFKNANSIKNRKKNFKC